MSDTYLTLSQLNTLIWETTMTALGYDYTEYNSSTSPPISMPVRKSWQAEGAPATKRTDDVCYIRVYPENNDYNKLRELKYSAINDASVNQATSYTRVLQVTWIFYGPNSYDNAQTVRDSLFSDNIADELEAKNVYFMPDIDDCTRAPELFDGQWWERTDLKAYFYELVTKNITVATVGKVTVDISNGSRETSAVSEET